MARGLNQRSIFAGLGLVALAAGALFKPARVIAERTSGCTCSDGRGVAVGVVGYGGKSFRETITRFEADGDGPNSRCRAVWVGSTEIRPRGTPYHFYVERITLGERRVDRCGYLADRLLERRKNYEFVFGADSISIREMRATDAESVLPWPANDSESKSNANLWKSITVERPVEILKDRKLPPEIDPTRELNRTSWVLARKEIQAHRVGVVKEIDQSERLVALKRIRKVHAGQLGQIEAVNAGSAIVRFYQGSRIERFTGPRNAFKRWYDNVGGPYAETKDDLYTPLGAYIVEVPVDDLVEVNDYLDQAKADRT
ncbi:MAG: hypothetical protein JWO19_4335 [Bryobacterales bacterium]|jgi:hypothetical protein|nr:hypothetical protein [Bryobacterales bacterium]